MFWFIAGFVTGLVVMAFFYYKNKKKMDTYVEAMKAEIKKLSEQIIKEKTN